LLHWAYARRGTRGSGPTAAPLTSISCTLTPTSPRGYARDWCLHLDVSPTRNACALKHGGRARTPRSHVFASAYAFDTGRATCLAHCLALFCATRKGALPTHYSAILRLRRRLRVRATRSRQRHHDADTPPFRLSSCRSWIGAGRTALGCCPRLTACVGYQNNSPTPVVGAFEGSQTGRGWYEKVSRTSSSNNSLSCLSTQHIWQLEDQRFNLCHCHPHTPARAPLPRLLHLRPLHYTTTAHTPHTMRTTHHGFEGHAVSPTTTTMVTPYRCPAACYYCWTTVAYTTISPPTYRLNMHVAPAYHRTHGSCVALPLLCLGLALCSLLLCHTHTRLHFPACLATCLPAPGRTAHRQSAFSSAMPCHSLSFYHATAHTPSTSSTTSWVLLFTASGSHTSSACTC